MSRTTALAVVPNRRPRELVEFYNSSGWSPSIWRRLIKENYNFDGYLFSDDNDHLDKLWRTIEDLPEWQQAPLVLTFDVGVIPFQAFQWAAEMLDEFDSRLPAPEGHVNHVPAMAELLRSGPETPLFGVYGTSVSENPFDPWDQDKDDYGTGIPLNEMYVLERHRSMIPRDKAA